MTEQRPKFTPGPWRSYTQIVEDLSGYCCYTTFGVECVKTRRGICGMYGADSEEEMKANADLIAAAPEMYAKLQELCKCGVIDTMDIEKLLAKARGEQQ